MPYNLYAYKQLYICMLYRQETVSAILSTQISNNDTEEDEDGDLDDEEVELMIDIGMVDIYFIVSNCNYTLCISILVRY